MHPRAEPLRHEQGRAAQPAADIEDMHAGRYIDQRKDGQCGGLAAGADEIAPVDRLVLADGVVGVLPGIQGVGVRLGYHGRLPAMASGSGLSLSILTLPW